MLVLALDTTTRTGSIALARDGQLVECVVGDAARTHAERLPSDIVSLLERHEYGVRDIDLYGVAAGPGSFTGLRVGIAAIQGLALANGRQVVAVSALEATARIGADARGGPDPGAGPAGTERAWPRVAAWMDAHRGEVFAALYAVAAGACEVLDPPSVEAPARVLARWAPMLEGRAVVFAGDGALIYRTVVEAALGASVRVIDPMPPLAPMIGRLAAEQAAAGRAVSPHAIQPLYVRRPDAEIARASKGAR